MISPYRETAQAERPEREYGGAYSPHFPRIGKTEKAELVLAIAWALAVRHRRQDKWRVAFASLSIHALRSGDFASHGNGSRAGELLATHLVSPPSRLRSCSPVESKTWSRGWHGVAPVCQAHVALSAVRPILCNLCSQRPEAVTISGPCESTQSAAVSSRSLPRRCWHWIDAGCVTPRKV
ncbi:hypothetical protein SAMN02745166_02759 [Prosthecobacter debontii]|uniref:Uncharacterized protein n=1 Tax=Prosthecobacter debontii TaxID=48467 RepID=A0A1T4YAV4_9BACT|nr:hypothetical protein SAMN02745166_02759 [Prosthecobacter debontii]